MPTLTITTTAEQAQRIAAAYDRRIAHAAVTIPPDVEPT